MDKDLDSRGRRVLCSSSITFSFFFFRFFNSFIVITYLFSHRPELRNHKSFALKFSFNVRIADSHMQPYISLIFETPMFSLVHYFPSGRDFADKSPALPACFFFRSSSCTRLCVAERDETAADGSARGHAWKGKIRVIRAKKRLRSVVDVGISIVNVIEACCVGIWEV